MGDSKKTPLTEWHREHGGRLVDFAGYEMPVRYEGVMAEHERVRRHCGVFDVSHMGELELRGSSARDNVQRLVTNDVIRLESGQALYTALCRETGGTIDDLLVYCLDDERFLVVCNAANHGKVLRWMSSHLDDGVVLQDRSEETSLFALQGPRSLDVLRDWPRLAPHRETVESLEYYHAVELDLDGVGVLLSRTGYTGERGYELYLPALHAVTLWVEILEAGGAHEIAPIGLGARDTLRLEAGYSLYGHELEEDVLPYEAGIGWVVKLKAGDFIGREALAQAKEAGVTRRTVALQLEGRNIPRQGAPVLAGGKPVGEITSGSFSPTLQRGIGLARVSADAVDETLFVDIRGKQVEAERVRLPFVPSRVKE